jgi:NADH-quinone oxidoreductase subunit H
MQRCSAELLHGEDDSRRRRSDRFLPTLGLSYGWAWFVATMAGVLLIALPLMLAVAMIIYADRKIWAAMALRRGPNVVGPFGLLQSFADGLKVFLQETIVPSAANKGCSCWRRSSPSPWR